MIVIVLTMISKKAKGDHDPAPTCKENKEEVHVPTCKRRS